MLLTEIFRKLWKKSFGAFGEALHPGKGRINIKSHKVLASYFKAFKHSGQNIFCNGGGWGFTAPISNRVNVNLGEFLNFDKSQIFAQI